MLKLIFGIVAAVFVVAVAAANDGRPRDVKATLITDGEPGAVEVFLRGRAAALLPPGRR